MDATLHLVSTGNNLCVKYGFSTTVAPLAAWPSTDIKFLEADEVKEIAGLIIKRWRTDLQNIEIAYIFKQKASKSGDTATLGQAKTESDLQKVLHKFEAVITIGFDTWVGLDQDQKFRLLEHELAHLSQDNDKGKLATIPHPIEEFPGVIQHWGPGSDAQIMFINAYESFKGAHSSLVKH